ncbi:hypothetical protein K501DRAFT_287967 [Backusella circina FSU 941]|nr:hypothetical protein K501DRAFT_287967 [Backusella circina FSU 941]
MDALKKECQQLKKTKHDTEKKLSSELEQYETDKLSWQKKEQEFKTQLQAFQTEGRTNKRRSIGINFPTINENTEPLGAPIPSPSLSTPSGPVTERLDHQYQQQQQQQKVPDMQREIKISKRTVKAQDKLILDLKKELEIQSKSIQDSLAQSRNQAEKLEQLEFELANVKRMNQSLMEENEGYQLLLHEKTLSGEFIQDPILQVENESGEGLNLALELNKVIMEDENQDGTHKVKALTDEVKTLQDTNRALQLYMSTILMRIIDNKQLESVLSIDHPTLPPLVSEKADRRKTWSNHPSVENNSKLASKGKESRRASTISPNRKDSSWSSAFKRMSTLSWSSSRSSLNYSSTPTKEMDESEHMSHSPSASNTTCREETFQKRTSIDIGIPNT